MCSKVWEPQLPSPNSSKEQERREPNFAISLISSTNHRLSVFAALDPISCFTDEDTEASRLRDSSKVTQLIDNSTQSRD